MADKDVKYDFAYAHETVEDEYSYCGFNIKVASTYSERSGTMYYAIADIGEPLLHAPDLHSHKHIAEKEIESFINKYIEENDLLTQFTKNE